MFGTSSRLSRLPVLVRSNDLRGREGLSITVRVDLGRKCRPLLCRYVLLWVEPGAPGLVDPMPGALSATIDIYAS